MAAPDRVNLDKVVLAVMPVVDVTARLPHEDALDQLASRQSIRLPAIRVRADPFERLLELVEEEILGVAILAPPLVLGLESPLGLSEQDDFHDALGTASGSR